MTEQLKPCPFCGGAANHASHANDNNSGWQHDVDHWVYCTSDDCLADMGMCETKDEAVRLWNTRTDGSECKQIGYTLEGVAKGVCRNQARAKAAFQLRTIRAVIEEGKDA